MQFLCQYIYIIDLQCFVKYQLYDFVNILNKGMFIFCTFIQWYETRYAPAPDFAVSRGGIYQERLNFGYIFF